MIRPPPTPTRSLIGQQRLHPDPFLVGQIMTMQHQKGLPHPAPKIRGTRSSRRSKSALLLVGRELDELLQDRYSDEPGVTEFHQKLVTVTSQGAA